MHGYHCFCCSADYNCNCNCNCDCDFNPNTVLVRLLRTHARCRTPDVALQGAIVTSLLLAEGGASPAGQRLAELGVRGALEALTADTAAGGGSSSSDAAKSEALDALSKLD